MAIASPVESRQVQSRRDWLFTKAHFMMPHLATYITLQSLSRLLIVELIFCLHLMPSARVLAEDVDGECDVPSVEPLASTSLTFHFNEDLNKTKRRFDVFLTKGVIHQKHQQVLLCKWISENINCFVSPGYEFNNVVSRTVTLGIPRASVEQVGTYTCETGNRNTSRNISCDFHLTLARKTMCDVRSVRLNTPTSLTCYFPEDISKTGADFTVYHYRNSSSQDTVLSYRATKKSLSTIDGYEFDGDVTDHLTVRIPSAVKTQEGNYSCHIPGVDFGQNCSFTLENVSQMRSTCNISSVQETKPAELTCAFSVDVNKTRKNFKVVRIGGEEIVSCNWPNNELSCSKSRGYEINETFTNHFVIKVTAASREHNGKYVCQLMDAEMDCFEPCEFNVLMTAGSTGIREHYNTATVAAYVIVAIIGTAFVAIVTFILWFQRRRHGDKRTGRGNNDQNQDRSGLL